LRRSGPAGRRATGYRDSQRPPALSTAETPVRPTEGLDTPGSKTSVREATTPLGIAVLFVPLAMQVYEPSSMVQEMVLPALVAAAPGAAVIEMTLPDGWVTVHSSSEGPAPENASETFSVTLLAAEPAVDSDREPVWP